MDIGRRGFLGGMVAAVAATADSMPSVPEGMRLYERHPISIVGEYAVVCDESPSFGTGLGNESGRNMV